MQLLELARALAAENPDFQTALGPGAGNRATNTFLRGLQTRATAKFGKDFCEMKICGETSQAVDFYFPAEKTIVEVALGLPNPASEFEKDVLKAIMAQEYGHDIKRLFFISRAGSAKKCAQPGRRAVMEWARTKHNLEIEVHELDGIPRQRRRSARHERDGADGA